MSSVNAPSTPLRPDRLLAGLLAVWLIGSAGGATGAEGPLELAGHQPPAPTARILAASVCSDDSHPPICQCRGPNRATTDQSAPDSPLSVERTIRGEFSDAGTPQLLAHLTCCGRSTAALFDRTTTDADKTSSKAGTWQLRRVYPATNTARCTRLDLQRQADLLVCHRTLQGDTWQIGLFHSLDFAGGPLERRQLTSYRSNARGCPTDTLRTEHPVGWRTWQAADDPRPPLLTIFFRHRNASVPPRFENACRAMQHGDIVFGKERHITEYFELRGRRLEFAGATARTGNARTSASWRTDERIETPICRRQTVLERIERRRDALQQCYADALDNEHRPTGILKLRWTIGPDGGVTATEVVSDELEAPKITDCLRRLVTRLSFVPPRAGDRCTFVYPFVFE